MFHEEREWRDSLKPGDDVWIPGEWGHPGRLMTVKRRTKTLIVCVEKPSGRGEIAFRAKDGRRPGRWKRENIRKPTAESAAYTERWHLIQRVETAVRAANVRSLPNESLHALLSLLTPATSREPQP